jgi:hypothetical protein
MIQDYRANPPCRISGNGFIFPKQMRKTEESKFGKRQWQCQKVSQYYQHSGHTSVLVV